MAIEQDDDMAIEQDDDSEQDDMAIPVPNCDVAVENHLVLFGTSDHVRAYRAATPRAVESLVDAARALEVAHYTGKHQTEWVERCNQIIGHIGAYDAFPAEAYAQLTQTLSDGALRLLASQNYALTRHVRGPEALPAAVAWFRNHAVVFACSHTAEQTCSRYRVGIAPTRGDHGIAFMVSRPRVAGFDAAEGPVGAVADGPVANVLAGAHLAPRLSRANRVWTVGAERRAPASWAENAEQTFVDASLVRWVLVQVAPFLTAAARRHAEVLTDELRFTGVRELAPLDAWSMVRYVTEHCLLIDAHHHWWDRIPPVERAAEVPRRYRGSPRARGSFPSYEAVEAELRRTTEGWYHEDADGGMQLMHYTALEVPDMLEGVTAALARFMRTRTVAHHPAVARTAVLATLAPTSRRFEDDDADDERVEFDPVRHIDEALVAQGIGLPPLGASDPMTGTRYATMWMMVSAMFELDEDDAPELAL